MTAPGNPCHAMLGDAIPKRVCLAVAELETDYTIQCPRTPCPSLATASWVPCRVMSCRPGQFRVQPFRVNVPSPSVLACLAKKLVP